VIAEQPNGIDNSARGGTVPTVNSGRMRAEQAYSALPRTCGTPSAGLSASPPGTSFQSHA
jgi:hypothetical protein